MKSCGAGVLPCSHYLNLIHILTRHTFTGIDALSTFSFTGPIKLLLWDLNNWFRISWVWKENREICFSWKSMLSRGSWIREKFMAALGRLSMIHLLILWTEGADLLPDLPPFSTLWEHKAMTCCLGKLPSGLTSWEFAEPVLWRSSNSRHKGSGQETFYLSLIMNQKSPAQETETAFH